MNRPLTAVALSLLIGTGSALAAGDHAAAPMMASPQKPLTEDDLRNEADAPQRSESYPAYRGIRQGEFAGPGS